MARVKCVTCEHLHKVKINSTRGEEIYYDCDQDKFHRFPYMTTVGGLLRPAQGIAKAAAACPYTQTHCILCETTDLVLMGLDIKLCREHEGAWGDWLDLHPEKREFATRRGRWLQTFREWVEEARKK